MPDIDDRLDYAPASFDHVSALEQSGVASHAIAQQTLITGAVLRAEIRAVVEVHVDEAELHDRARNFCAEAEGDPFVGLNVNDQTIGLQVFYRGIPEEHERSAPEMNHYFRGSPLEALSGAQIERDARPAPVVDLQLHGDEGFRVGFGRDVGLAAIAVYRRTADCAGTVLAANHRREHIFGAQRLDGVQYFRLLVAHFVRVERNGRLHGGHRQQLEEMVRHHVPERARGFVKIATMLDTNGLRGRDLHVVDVVAIPQRLDNVIGEAEDHNVLHGFFAQVMVYPIDLIFVENLFEIFVELARR